MQDLQLFNFDGHEVRTITDDQGEPWFVASDVAKIRGYRDAEKMTRNIRDKHKGTHNLGTLGGNQNLSIISEPGLYSAIMKSRVEGAERFQDWVTEEVLPAIRKHGGYLTPASVEKALTDPDFIIQLATQLKEERAAKELAQAEVKALQPKAQFADAVATSSTTILVGELAKIIKGNGIDMGQNRLFEWLREEGWLIKRKGTDWNMPTQKAMDAGLFEIKETAIAHSDGHVTINKTPKVTGKGQQYFINRFLG